MICPKCQAEGKTSKIYGGFGISMTCVGFQPYYDEDGKYHYRNPNAGTSEYTCTNGHKIVQIQGNKCQNCDWGHEQETRVE
jgi:hypothetical protein